MIQYDLFEHYELQSIQLKEIVDKYLDILENSEEDSYIVLKQFHNDVNQIGYTFDYYLDGMPYGLRPIGIELNQLIGWED